jgi:hypothetical protein
MCVYSVIADEYHRQIQPYPYPLLPPGMDRETIDKLDEVLRKVREIDTKLGIADCGPEKVTGLLAELRKRVAALEAAGKTSAPKQNRTKPRGNNKRRSPVNHA